MSEEPHNDPQQPPEEELSDEQLRRFTETVQLRSALVEVPKRAPAMPRGGSNMLPVAIAGALVLIGALITVMASDGTSGDQLATATLANDGASIDVELKATAALLRDGDLQRLRVNFDDQVRDVLINTGHLSPESEHLALWLTDPVREQVLPLGVVDGDTVAAIPNNIDITNFAVVDVSIEPTDGNPAHSGRTVIRGVLEQP